MSHGPSGPGQRRLGWFSITEDPQVTSPPRCPAPEPRCWPLSSLLSSQSPPRAVTILGSTADPGAFHRQEEKQPYLLFFFEKKNFLEFSSSQAPLLTGQNLVWALASQGAPQLRRSHLPRRAWRQEGRTGFLSPGRATGVLSPRWPQRCLSHLPTGHATSLSLTCRRGLTKRQVIKVSGLSVEPGA